MDDTSYSNSSSSSVPDDNEAEHRRNAAFAALRRLTTPEYILRQTIESTTAGLIFSPVTMLYFTLLGIFDARYPSSMPVNNTMNPSLVRNTPSFSSSSTPGPFASYLSLGLKEGMKGTLRCVGWLGGTAALTAGLTELVKVGPRHEDNFILNPLYLGSCFLGGSITGLSVSRGYHNLMGRNRLFIFFILTGCMGISLPPFLARNGPVIRQRLNGYIGNE